jgi:bacterioferritin-associated ferredoxin
VAVVSDPAEAVTVMALDVRIARVEAVFCSCLQPSDHPIREQVQGAIANMARITGCRGCTAQVAQAFGEHPELAAARMRWARNLVDEAFPPRRSR